MALVFEVELQRMKWRLKRTWTRQVEGEGMKTNGWDVLC